MPRTLHLSSRRCSADYVSRAHWPEGAIYPFTSYHRLAGQAMTRKQNELNTTPLLPAREVCQMLTDVGKRLGKSPSELQH
jgi:hypothetical protein